MRDSPHGAQAFKYARNAFPLPLTALQHDDGRTITAPDSMDELTRTKWAGVYEDNSQHHGATIINYLCKYAKHIHSSPEVFIF